MTVPAHKEISIMIGMFLIQDIESGQIYRLCDDEQIPKRSLLLCVVNGQNQMIEFSHSKSLKNYKAHKDALIRDRQIWYLIIDPSYDRRPFNFDFQGYLADDSFYRYTQQLFIEELLIHGKKRPGLYIIDSDCNAYGYFDKYGVFICFG